MNLSFKIYYLIFKLHNAKKGKKELWTEGQNLDAVI